MNDDQPAVIVENLYKSFRLPIEKHNGIKQAIIGIFNGTHGYNKQQVLNDVSFTINKGEFFGIVGRNGSGKSTLLKLLANIYTPDKGSVHVNGSLMPFIELGVGFNPELTGSENIFLNGALLGFSRKEMEAMYDDIVEFAELEKFMDQKLKNYSSGMQVRLAFSIAIRANSDILLLDEVLAVGDEAFQRKCFNYFAQLKKEKKTVILVTHSMEAVQQFCTSAIMIDKGEIIAEGNPAKIAQTYRELFAPSILSDSQGSAAYGDVEIKAKVRRDGGKVRIEIGLHPKIDIADTVLSIFLDRDNGEQVYRFSTDERTGKLLQLKKDTKVILKIDLQDIFPNGIFSIRASIKSFDRTKEHALAGDLASFEVDRRVETGSQWDIHWNPEESFIIEGR